MSHQDEFRSAVSYWFTVACARRRRTGLHLNQVPDLEAKLDALRVQVDEIGPENTAAHEKAMETVTDRWVEELCAQLPQVPADEQAFMVAHYPLQHDAG